MPKKLFSAFSSSAFVNASWSWEPSAPGYATLVRGVVHPTACPKRALGRPASQQAHHAQRCSPAQRPPSHASQQEHHARCRSPTTVTAQPNGRPRMSTLPRACPVPASAKSAIPTSVRLFRSFDVRRGTRRRGRAAGAPSARSCSAWWRGTLRSSRRRASGTGSSSSAGSTRCAPASS